MRCSPSGAYQRPWYRTMVLSLRQQTSQTGADRMASCTWPLRHFTRHLTERRSALWECLRKRCSVLSWRKVRKKTRPQEHSWESIAALLTVLPEEHLPSWCWAASFELGCRCSSRIYRTSRRSSSWRNQFVRPSSQMEIMSSFATMAWIVE